MDKFDREMQLLILKAAVDSYPSTTSSSQFLNQGIFSEPNKAIANTHYLMEHGLIRCVSRQQYEFEEMADCLVATKDGIDFLLQDDGLNAILNVTTIRFHDDAVAVIAGFINQNVGNTADKQKFLHQLRALPYETTKHIALELVSKGLAQTPNAIQWLQTLIHHT